MTDMPMRNNSGKNVVSLVMVISIHYEVASARLGLCGAVNNKKPGQSLPGCS
jgi:hypothetical protein